MASGLKIESRLKIEKSGVSENHNQILSALPERESRRLLPHLSSLSMQPKTVLYSPGELVRYVYFPQSGVVSLLILMQDGKSAAVSLTGNEGIVGFPSAILGSDKAAYSAVVQVPGTFLKIRAEIVQAEFRHCDVLHDRVLAYTRYLLAYVSQTAACNALHLLTERLARWLLMIHDRAGADEFSITHEFLSEMLGISRSEVTRAAGLFRKLDLIRYRHGTITILDRKGLESIACECREIVT